ncbi:hypothetical protein DPMN_024743 [Dreissena polymorpha]|uniref:Uncharacterized protein n=1 Tax=Dreissena polymorpha TaxID=45954 RepID=A0A9D4RBW9_DREPO|nr:hypothetical protein DPMN_024743 [Dreissena polymorpha]
MQTNLIREVEQRKTLLLPDNYACPIDRPFNRPDKHSHVIKLTGTIFELNSRIKETNAKNVTFTVFTCFHCIHIEKNAPPTGGHVFSSIPTIFKLVRDINNTNVLTNFHDDWPKIVTSRVFTRFLYSQIGKTATVYIHIEKNAPPTGGHVFLTDLDHFQTRPRHQLNKSKIVTSRVFTRKTAPPTGGHLLTKCHEDVTRNQLLTDGRTFDGQRPVTKAHLSNQVS